MTREDDSKGPGEDDTITRDNNSKEKSGRTEIVMAGENNRKETEKITEDNVEEKSCGIEIVTAGENNRKETEIITEEVNTRNRTAVVETGDVVADDTIDKKQQKKFTCDHCDKKFKKKIHSKGTSGFT
ncbi:hypothetical protein Pcinc_012518 [Petrolisthes cinctipes]|uniref:Uncharacterized protein n=1 Tax=Petrolisthes cinctipes TaxID=88211 RepID=A0AAE1KTI0_PETCI|nr:hypothetical protein Pcinc_012518 [Petrolisthes cinctipes]